MRIIGIICIIGIIGVIILGFAFVSSNNQTELQKQNSSLCQIKDFENGVLYFDCTDSQFATTLSKYILNNPNITIQSISGTNQDFYGEDHGYIVVIKK
jgi:hypothetical protein